MINAEKRGRRIELKTRLPLRGMKTAVPGAYQRSDGTWTVPLNLESCKLLREKFGQRMQIGAELRRWARGEIDAREQMGALSKATTARLTRVPKAAPRLYKAMRNRKYQLVGARYIADSGSCLIADDPGLGKTLQVLAGVLESGVPGPYLIVCPKTATDSVWRREIERWLPKPHRAVVMPEFRYQREHTLALTRLTDTTWIIVNPEMMMVAARYTCAECGKITPVEGKQQVTLKCGHRKDKRTVHSVEPNYPQIHDVKWGVVIADESHETLIVRTRISQRRRGMELVRIRSDGMRIAVSGTPFDHKPHQLWGTLNWLDSVTYSAFYRWAELYWMKGGYTGFEIGEFRKDREQMLWDSLQAIALRRTKPEVASDLPPKVYVGTPYDPFEPETSPVGIWLPMGQKQAEAYRQMEEYSVAQLESGRLEAVGALAEITRLRQMACCYGDIMVKPVRVSCRKLAEKYRWYTDICAECLDFGFHMEDKPHYTPRLPSNKFQWTVEHLEEWGYPRDPLTKIIIVSFFTGILNEFRAGVERHFKTKPDKRLCTAITGQVGPKHRRDIIDRFNTDEGPRIMFLNVKAGGVAITIDTADKMIFLSETRNPMQQLQAEDRIHRVSNPRHCEYYYLRSQGTVDIGTALLNEEAKRDAHRLLDGRRGVEYARTILELSH